MKTKIIIFLTASIYIISLFSFSSCSIFSSKVTGTISDTQSYSTDETEQQTADQTEQETKETQTSSSDETETTLKENDMEHIRVTKPKPDQVIESPLLIEGEARGTWYFEATFPVKLLDANGNEIASHYAQAQGEWMTESFVAFSAELEFEKPSTVTGKLVLEKDNPSGLPENDASIEIPVRFSDSGKIVEDTDPQAGEYFVYAILKSIDLKNNSITVEQLFNEPNEKEISPEVILFADCKVVKVTLEKPEEKETVSEISLDSIPLGSEIGIIFKPDNTARAIIYQEVVENN